ncbi:MAG: NfeD family protein [Treponemataceae bacterium]|nr:NfeD family protein [Treponemataceae bacterium]
MIEYLMAHLPWFWLAMAILMSVLELILPGLTTIWFALGSLVMIPLSLLPIPFVIQVVICLVISVVLLVFTRPFAMKKLKANKEKTNVDALIGKSVLVLKDISKFEKGEVKVNGVVWSARSDDDAPLKAGDECFLLRIEGATAVVGKEKPVEAPAE